MVVQKKLTDNFPKRRVSTRTAEKRKLAKSVKDLSLNENIQDEDIEEQPKIDESSLESFRKALDTSSPENLPGREAQIYEVKQFLLSNLEQKRSGSMYISGAPGTGKTAVVRYVLDEIMSKGAKTKKKLSFYQIVINCMCRRSANDIYEVVMDNLKTSSQKSGSYKERVRERVFSKSKSAKMIVIVLDEMDQILKGCNEVLYSLFEWARSPDSKLILIGIANALDLTVRHLPFLHLNSSPVKQPRLADGEQLPLQNQCRIISFPPYHREDIEKIIQVRMEQVGQNIFQSSAIKFVAAKVAASTGDARKALHACKEAIVTVEKQEHREVLKEADDNGITSSLSPKKICIRNDQIGIVAVSKVLQIRKDDGPLPLQQTTVLAALLQSNREAPNTREPLVDGVNKPIPMSLLYKQYRKICSLKGFSWIEESELPSVCEILQDRSLVSIVSSGNSSSKKFSAGTKRFGSPSANNVKIGVTFDPKGIESIVFRGDLKTLFG
ncbi:unnamed protein product [Orchesella dallaii]|uniref:Cell division control protein n=1 Tax=Orchesella dallaii TaxID=48710 RepID=A0ABP1Q6W2_9HEXA